MNPCHWHQRVYFVTSRGKSALEDYFDIAPELERTLRRIKLDMVEAKSTNMESGAIAYPATQRHWGLAMQFGAPATPRCQ
jgi:UTP-glucose-1-phosphate uridylyltransferase